ncbi:hypothetical protein BY998_11827 [Methylobacterium sp. B4]|nr:hypothetical protein BY998_11827 [Methylobacterium sp. B4]
MPMEQRPTGAAGTPRRGGWRFGLAALLGALAGATLFPRPAKGAASSDTKGRLRADPAPAAPGSAPPSG